MMGDLLTFLRATERQSSVIRCSAYALDYISFGSPRRNSLVSTANAEMLSVDRRWIELVRILNGCRDLGIDRFEI